MVSAFAFPQFELIGFCSQDNASAKDDATKEPDEIRAEVEAMLSGSPEPIAEEWALHDHEGFG